MNRGTVLVCAAIVLLLGGVSCACAGRAGQSTTPTASATTVPSGHWTELDVVHLPASELGGDLGPLRLQTGRLRIEARVAGAPASGLLDVTGIMMSEQVESPTTSSPSPPPGFSWHLSPPASGTKRIDLAPGRWHISVGKTPGFDVKVTVYEER